MARRPAGINLGRVRESLGRGQDTSVVEDVLFGGRNTPPLESVQPLETGWLQSESSRLSEYKYSYSESALYVRWRNNGTVWMYEDVPVAVFETFSAAASMGRYVNGTLNHFAFHQVYDKD